jgi:hypothetical protein
VIGPVVRRQMMLAEAQAAREQAAWDRQQAERIQRSAEQRESAAVAAAQYRAESAGSHYDAMQLARGEIPARTLGDVLGEARDAADRPSRDPSAAYGSPGNPVMMVGWQELPEPVRRSSGWPGSEAELDRMIGQYEDGHRELVAYRSQHDYAAAEAEARAKSERGHAARSRQPGAVPLGYYDADRTEIARGTENAIRGVW